MEEIWKLFPLDDRFMVSDQGRVRGQRSILSLQPDKDGYRYFMGWRGGRQNKTCKSYRVHRAVVMTFIGDIPEGMVVNHLNGIKDDNRLENLEICTVAQNAQHSFKVLGQVIHKIRAKGEKHGNARFTAEQVLEMRRLAATGMRQVDIARQFGTAQAYVSAVVRRIAWSHV